MGVLDFYKKPVKQEKTSTVSYIDRVKRPFFDAVLFIDCWEEKWMFEFGVTNARSSYGRMLDFISTIDIGLALHSSGDGNIHNMFYSLFNDIPQVETFSQLNVHAAPGSKILLAGQAFGGCFHHNQLGAINLLKKGYHVFSSPLLIGVDWETPLQDARQHIEGDKKLRWEKNFNDLYRAFPIPKKLT